MQLTAEMKELMTGVLGATTGKDAPSLRLLADCMEWVEAQPVEEESAPADE